MLVAASRELASSFDYAQTLAACGRLVVPSFASGFSVEVEEGEIRTTVVQSGRVSPDSPLFPLIARGRLLGAMRVEGGSADLLDGVSLWDELATRVAVSIDAGQTFARERYVADTLQRALLPEHLPHDDRLAFDAAYLPGAAEAEVGGDWYDAFRLPDGRIAFSVGDVAGHGLRAAIVMGEVRQAVRAAAHDAASPAAVLERANAIVNMRPAPVMVTALFGVVDPTDGVVTYACAGHPAPILALPDGAAMVLSSAGLPLGIVDSCDAVDRTTTIPAGAMLVGYTDGAIEFARDPIAGERQLVSTAGVVAQHGTREAARRLLDRLFADTRNTDDVAALTISGPPDVHGRTFRFVSTALPAIVPFVRRAFERWLDANGIVEDERFAVIVATGEAMANAVEHAYAGSVGTVALEASLDDRQLHVVVEDAGRWRPAQRRDERGRGLPLMRTMMDGVEIRTNSGRTSVRLTKQFVQAPART